MTRIFRIPEGHVLRLPFASEDHYFEDSMMDNAHSITTPRVARIRKSTWIGMAAAFLIGSALVALGLWNRNQTKPALPALLIGLGVMTIALIWVVEFAPALRARRLVNGGRSVRVRLIAFKTSRWHLLLMIPQLLVALGSNHSHSSRRMEVYRVGIKMRSRGGACRTRSRLMIIRGLTQAPEPGSILSAYVDPRDPDDLVLNLQLAGVGVVLAS